MCESFTFWGGKNKFFVACRGAGRLMLCSVLMYSALLMPSCASEDALAERVKVEVVEGVELKDEEREHMRELVGLLSKTEGGGEMEALFERIKHKLFLQGYVVRVEGTRTKSGEQLVVRVVKRLPKIVDIVCKGIGTSEKETLLALLPCKKNNFLLPYHKKEAKDILESYFREQGFANTQVAVVEKSRTGNATKLCCVIKRGRKHYIRKVWYKGNSGVSNEELEREMLYTKGCIDGVGALAKKLCSASVGVEGLGHLWRFIMGTVFVEAYLKQDIEILKHYYRSKGYMNVAINYGFKATKYGYVFIVLNIKEGVRYRMGKVVWRGNRVCTTKELDDFLGFHRGSVFDVVALQKKLYGQQEGIKAFYEDRKGYLSSFDLQTYQRGHDEVDLEIKLEEAPPRVIDKVIITTDVPINFSISNVLKCNGLQKGKVLTHKKLAQAEAMLSHTNLFRQKSIKLTSVPGQGDKVCVACNLGVKRNDSFFRGGLMDGFDFGGTFRLKGFDIKGILEKKRRAGSQQLSLQLTQNLKDLCTLNILGLLSNPKRRFALSIKDIISPRYSLPPFDKPLFLDFDIFYSPARYSTQRETKMGTGISLGGKRGGRHDMTQWGMQLGYNHYELDNIEWSEGELLNKSHANQILFSTTYTTCSTDDLFYPTQGSKLDISAKKSFNIAPSGNALNMDYSRMIGTYSKYKSLPKLPGWKRPMTIRFASSLGASSFDSTSPVGGFFLGKKKKGLESVLGRYYVPLRGYHSEDIPISKEGQGHYPGGKYFIMSNVELRYALTDTKASYLLAFGDFASGTPSIQDPFHTWGLSCGVGFTTKTPMASLSCGFAWRLNRDRNLLPRPYMHFDIKL